MFVLQLIVLTSAAQVVSPFNKLKLKDTAATYSFIVSGHFHGASTNLSTFPAATVLANTDTLNSFQPAFLFTLGDMFLDLDKNYIDHYQRALFSKLKMPVFNAVGNHDLSNGDMYEKTFGATYYSFIAGLELFIVLNTEKDDGSIKGEQLEMLQEALKKGQQQSIKNIFILSHRPIWSENDPAYTGLFAGNTRTALGSNNYEKEIKPLLTNISKVKNIYWMSGSMANAPASFFYHKDESSNITFMQTAIRDLPRDAVLLVTADKGIISFKGISLTGQSLEPIEHYGIEYWKKSVPEEEKFNYRLLPLMIFKAIMHPYFWSGFAVALLLFLLLRFVNKRWKKRK
ncbi:MAG: hypothetical protein JWO44_1540 [Bacteroidetes bacterium]|nr:hypothetical protein [Bacteroidota bacterium]